MKKEDGKCGFCLSVSCADITLISLMFVTWIPMMFGVVLIQTVEPVFFPGNRQILPDPGLSGQDAFCWFYSGIHSYAIFRMDNMK